MKGVCACRKVIGWIDYKYLSYAQMIKKNEVIYFFTFSFGRL